MGKGEAYKVTLPDGKQHKLHNGDRGFFMRTPHTIRCTEGLIYRMRGMKLVDQMQLGERAASSSAHTFPDLHPDLHLLTCTFHHHHHLLPDRASSSLTVAPPL